MRRSRAFISRGTIEPKEMSEAMRDLDQASDRAAAIIAGSLIEIELTAALTHHLHRDEKITSDLFRTTGALGAFATKIQIGFLTGLYGKEAHRDLLIVKDIRNAFAHRLDTTSFKSDKISSWCKNLKFCDRYSADEDEIRRRAEAGEMPKVADGKTPFKDWEYWIQISDRASALLDPRERYIVTAQIFLHGLLLPDRTRMPAPLF